MNAIEVNNLCLNRKDFTLDHITFALPEGAILGLIGENGAGKTTTIQLLLHQLAPKSGEIFLLGEKDWTARQLEDIGVVPDDIGFSPFSTAAQLNKILRHVYKNWQEDTFTEYLSKLNVPPDKPFERLSLGMKKKLAIAVALSHDPKLLLLDEACSGLDPLAREQVLEMLFDFTRREDHTILLSSHIVSDLEKLCDYIAFMHKGRLLLFSEKDRLYETYGLLHCDASTLSTLPKGAVLGKRSTEYGTKALVKRELLPQGLKVSPVMLEEIFLYMVKEEN